MLVAKMKSGATISLVNVNQKMINKQKLKKQKYYCPICQETVTLKLGEKRSWHFAHQRNSKCKASVEPETAYHLEGKIQLYHWLRKQNLPIRLEYYLKEIKQRPDLLVKTKHGLVAVEFQCSTISEKDLLKRTEMYRCVNIVPLWILGKKRLKRRGGILQISTMDWLTMRKKRFPYLSYYSPTDKAFTIVHSPISFSERKTFAAEYNHHISSISLGQLLQPEINSKINSKQYTDLWLKEKEKWRLYCHYDARPCANFLRGELYKRRLYLCYVPSICGVPLKQSVAIKTPAVYWQTWLVLTFIYAKKRGEIFSITSVCKAFFYLLGKKLFEIREFPCIEGKVEHHVLLAIKEYLHFLCSMRVIKKRTEKLYVIMNEISFSTSNYEAIGSDKRLLQKKLIK